MRGYTSLLARVVLVTKFGEACIRTEKYYQTVIGDLCDRGDLARNKTLRSNLPHTDADDDFNEGEWTNDETANLLKFGIPQFGINPILLSD